MKRADIYIKTDSASPKISEKKYGYVLQCEVAGESKTREGFGVAMGTYHQVILETIIEALERFREPCEIHIHTEDTFVLNMMERNLESWANNEFQTVKGKPVANQEEWKKVWELSNEHLILTEPGEHEYSGWILTEMKKKEEKEKKNVR